MVTMSHSRTADWILETIDHLRKRKARPDLKHICHMVKRRFGLSFRETEAIIEKLVDSEIVIKVDYKGSTSYRNAAKWKKNNLGGVVLNSSVASGKFREAIEALTHLQENNVDGRRGSSTEEVASWLEKNFDGFKELKSPVAVILQREVDTGHVEKLPDGRFAIPEKNINMKTTKSSSANNSSSSTFNKTAVGVISVHVPARRGRPPKNKKKFRRSHGSEGEPMEVERRPSALPEQRCDFCQQTAVCNPKGFYEELLVCKDCTAKAHPSCMDYSEELSFRARKGPWQCIDCKTCFVCEDAGDPDLMLFCDGCDKGYHMNCHVPQVMEKPLGKWVCDECTNDGVNAEELERQEKEKEVERENHSPPNHLPLMERKHSSSMPPTPAESPTTEDAGARPRFERSEHGFLRKKLSKVPRFTGNAYPDASDWSISDVVDFFVSAGFSEQAEAFRDQEIDGKSLLLMKRSDVLTGLSIKLGPALKIHRHVQHLQMAGMDAGSPA